MAGYSYFVPPSATGLIGNYAGLILCAIGYIVTKLWTRSKMIPLDKIDLDTGKADIMFTEEDRDEIIGSWYNRAWKRFVNIFT